MGLSLLIILSCVLLGTFTVLASRHPVDLSALADGSSGEPGLNEQHFTPRKTMFIIGPSRGHAACNLQRRLLKPALATLIREDISVMELYGDETPYRNGAALPWLDASLLRFAMDARQGFVVLYVDENGKTLFKRNAPMLGAEVLAASGLYTPKRTRPSTSPILQKLSAA